jgi:hypothetical protein
MEIWYDIVEFEDYQVSNMGRVKSFKRKEKILNGMLGSKEIFVVIK